MDFNKVLRDALLFPSLFMSFRTISLLAAMLASSTLAVAQEPPVSAQHLWRAEWITSQYVSAREEAVLHFRKFLDLPKDPQHFWVCVSADNRFVLYVNQERIGMGPARSDLAHWKFETYDLAPALKLGRNVIAAVVWNFGARDAQAQISDRTAFLLQGAGEAEETVDTNDTWEVAEEKGIQSQPKPVDLENFYFVAEPSLRMTGAILDWGWNSAEGSTGKWDVPTSLGRGSEIGAAFPRTKWQLLADPLPPMEMKLVSAGRVVRMTEISEPNGFPGKAFTVPANSIVSVLLDNDHLTTSYPELTVSRGAGASIRLTYSEALIDEKGNKGNRNKIDGKHIVGAFDEFLPDGGNTRVFMPLVWRTWRYLQLDIKTASQPVVLEELRSWFTAFPFEERARFQSGDLQLQAIWDIGWRTARLDAHDTYMDTPYWEQLQYIGDTRIQALISYVVAGDDRLARQAIQAFNDSRIPEGITYSRYPTSMFQGIPPFSLLWIGMVHDFWRYRGDMAFVKSQLAGTRAVLDWFLQHRRDDGLLTKLPWWPFADWGEDFDAGIPPQDVDGGSSILTLQFVEALRNQADLETALGDPSRATIYRDVASRAAAAVNKLCWNAGYQLLADTPLQRHYSQHANILGVWLDVIPADKQQSVLARILSVSDAAFKADREVPNMTKATYYFRFYLARAIEHAEMGDDYLRLLSLWKEMVSLGLTTWAEQPEPTRSDSHAWSAHPNFDLLTIVAGIRPATPAFATVVIEPHLGSLKHLAASEPHPHGHIDVEYSMEASGVKARIALPSGITGELRWKAKTYPLHEGPQALSLPAQ
jgi:alpha-L-rhamnosidase